MTKEITNQPTVGEQAVTTPSIPQGTQAARAMALRETRGNPWFPGRPCWRRP